MKYTETKAKKDVKVKLKDGEFLPDFFRREFPQLKVTDDTLFITDEHLDNLPLDWFDCVSFLVAENFGKNNSFLICLEEDETLKMIEFTKKDTIRLLVESDKFWEVMLVKQDEKNNRAFLGGENLRKYCDQRNIFYRSFLTDSGLISGTTMEWQKNINEDCRVPRQDLK